MVCLANLLAFLWYLYAAFVCDWNCFVVIVLCGVFDRIQMERTYWLSQVLVILPPFEHLLFWLSSNMRTCKRTSCVSKWAAIRQWDANTRNTCSRYITHMCADTIYFLVYFVLKQISNACFKISHKGFVIFMEIMLLLHGWEYIKYI